MAKLPVPINQITRRIPEAGRIRLGVKTAKAMKSIDTFRFTSQDRQSIDQVAALYGGEVKAWSDPKAVGNQWQVLTEATELRVALPPDPLGDTPIYELYGGGGRERACDGETCERMVQGPDGIDLESGPCICFAKGALECKLKCHLSVLLPDVRFLGTWRLTTGSENAAKELPGMVELIQSLQSRGIQRAVLRVERREQRVAGLTRKFVVPVLGLDSSVNELVAGSTALGQIAGPERLAIEAGAPELEGSHDYATAAGEEDAANDFDDATEYVHDPDDEIVDAEVVEIEGREVIASDDPPTAGALRKLFAVLRPLGIEDDDDARHEFANEVLGRNDITSFKQLSGDDVYRLTEEAKTRQQAGAVSS